MGNSIWADNFELKAVLMHVHVYTCMYLVKTCVHLHVLVCMFTRLFAVQVNDVDMGTATHTEAVSVLKNIKDACVLVVSREVLVVTPDDRTEENECKCQNVQGDRWIIIIIM